MILLQVIFISGILLSIKNNNNLTLKLSVILLLFSILINCTREQFEPEVIENCGDEQQKGNKCIIKKTNGPNFVCTMQSIKNGKNKHCVSSDTITNADGSSSLCINSFDNIDILNKEKKYNDIRPCNNVGAIVYGDNGNDYVKITSEMTDRPEFAGKDNLISDNNSNMSIQFTDISKIRLYRNYEMHIFSDSFLSGNRQILKAYPESTDSSNYYWKQLAHDSNKSIYKEYSKSDFQFIIKSFKLINIQKELYLEHKNLSHYDEINFHYKKKSDGIGQINRNECIKQFDKKDDSTSQSDKKVNYIITNNDINDDLDDNMPSENVCLHSKFPFMTDDTNTNILKASPGKSIIQKNPIDYSIFYGKKSADSDQIKPRLTKKYTVKDCADLCNLNNECIGIQYSSKYQPLADEIGNCILLNNFDINSQSKSKSSYDINNNIYIKKNTTGAVCKTDIYNNDEFHNTIQQINTDVNKLTFSDYLNEDKIKDTYDVTIQDAMKEQTQISHSQLIKVYENPANVIKIMNINATCHTVKLMFNGPTNIANIHVYGKGAVTSGKDTKLIHQDWANINNNYVNINVSNNTDNVDTQIMENIPNKENCIDNNICSYFTVLPPDESTSDSTPESTRKSSPEIETDEDTMKDSPFIELSFIETMKDDSKKPIPIIIEQIVIYVYNKSYGCSDNTVDIPTNEEYPLQVELYAGTTNALIAKIKKQSRLDKYNIKYYVPKLPNDDITYANINDFGLPPPLFRGWINIDGTGPTTYCRFVQDQHSKNMIRLKCSLNGDDTIPPILSKSYYPKDVQNIFFINTTDKSNEDMCKCITKNNKTLIECTKLQSKYQGQTYNLTVDINKTCDELNIEVIKKLILNKRLDYCGDIHSDFLNRLKYKIDAGFFYANQLFYLFKNTTINGIPKVLFRIESKNHVELRNGTCIVCETTFPGLDFTGNGLDRIDAAMIADPKKGYVYFFRYDSDTNENYVIKYDIKNKRIVCDKVNLTTYPKKASDEFPITTSNSAFFEKRIIGAVFIGDNDNKECYLFTEHEFINYNLNKYAIINSSDKRLSYRNPNWPKMSFGRLTCVMSGLYNKRILFFNENRFTEVKKDNHIWSIVSDNQNKLIINVWPTIWNISPRKLVSTIHKYHTKYRPRSNSCKLPETSQAKNIRLRNDQSDMTNKLNEQQSEIISEIKKQQESINNNNDILIKSENKLKVSQSMQKKIQNDIKNYEKILENKSLSEDEKTEITTPLNKLKIINKNMDDIINKTTQSTSKLKAVTNILSSAYKDTRNIKTHSPDASNIQITLPDASNVAPLDPTRHMTDNYEKVFNVPLNTILTDISSDGSNFNIINKNNDGTYNILTEKTPQCIR